MRNELTLRPSHFAGRNFFARARLKNTRATSFLPIGRFRRPFFWGHSRLAARVTSPPDETASGGGDEGQIEKVADGL